MGGIRYCEKESRLRLTKQDHRRSLDGLRGVSILAVMGFHAGSRVIRGGHLGVDMFFVLSGFLITFLLLQEQQNHGSINLKNFYIRRALRLLPAMIFLLVLSGAYASLMAPSADATAINKGILYTILYSSNWYQAFNGMGEFGPLSHTWSLSIEEQFYILWPLLVIVLLRLFGRSRYVITLLILSILLVAYNRARLWNGSMDISRAYFGLDTRADAILTGCLAAFLVFFNMLPPIAVRFSQLLSITIILLVGAMGLLSSNHDPYLYFGGFTFFALLIGALIILLLETPPEPLNRMLEFRPLVWIGRISYGLYLWHIPTFYLCSTMFPRASLMRLGLQVFLTFVIAGFSYYVIELPFLKLKEGFKTATPANSPAASPATV